MLCQVSLPEHARLIDDTLPRDGKLHPANSKSAWLQLPGVNACLQGA